MASDREHKDNISELNSRIDGMEQAQIQILEVLHNIEVRLIGDLKGDKPGLIDDLRGLRKAMESIDVRMGTLEKANIQMRVESLESSHKTHDQQISEFDKRFNEITKYKWILYGIIILVGFIFNKAWELVVAVWGHKTP